MRWTQLYLQNNPVYQRAVDNIRNAFRQIWQATDDLIFDIGETEMRWEDHAIYSQEQRNESIAWTLYKDGVRSLSFKPGVEDTEIVRFLAVLQQAKNLQADAPDDLLTLLWAEDFQFVTYTFRELASENAVPIERTEKTAPTIGGGGDTPGEDGGSADPTTVRRQVEEEAPPKREGLVSIDDFDTTLYFLDDKEIEYLHKEVEREYAQDLRGNVLAMLFDLLELQTYGPVRAELQSLVEATSHPTEAELSELFSELRAEALGTLMGWLPKLTNERVRSLVQGSAERLAQSHAAEVLKALASADPAVQLEMVRLAGRLKLPGAPDGMGALLERGERELKLAVVEALTTIGTPGATRLLEKAIEDQERDVRITAVKFLGQRGHRNACSRIEAAVTGGKLKDADLTEKMAFFEAYGALAGESGIPTLEKLLVARSGLLARKEDPETRACAAMALG